MLDSEYKIIPIKEIKLISIKIQTKKKFLLIIEIKIINKFNTKKKLNNKGEILYLKDINLIFSILTIILIINTNYY